MRMLSTSGSTRGYQADLADKLTRLFNKPIEAIFELDADCGIDIPV